MQYHLVSVLPMIVGNCGFQYKLQCEINQVEMGLYLFILLSFFLVFFLNSPKSNSFESEVDALISFNPNTNKMFEMNLHFKHSSYAC